MSLPSPEEKAEATRTDIRWEPIPGFPEYDLGSNNKIRRRTTNNIVRVTDVGTCQLRKENGQWVTRSYPKIVDFMRGIGDYTQF